MSEFEPDEQFDIAPASVDMRPSRNEKEGTHNKQSIRHEPPDVSAQLSQIENPRVEQPKKLSKIQQLAKQNAVLKRAARASQSAPAPAPAPASPASPMSKLRLAPNDPVSPVSPQVAEILPEAKPIVIGITNENDGQEYERHHRAVASACLEDPSAFANIVLGATNCSRRSRKGYADRVFSCFAVGSDDNTVSASEAFTMPSPDDIVQKAQGKSKGKSFGLKLL